MAGAAKPPALGEAAPTRAGEPWPLAVWSTAVLLFGLVAAGVLGYGLGDAGAHFAWWTWPGGSMVGGVMGFLVLAAVGDGARRVLCRLAASGCLLFVWYSYRVLTMGDGHDWRLAAEAGWLGASEPLASFVLAAVARFAGGAALDALPPLFGLLATYAWLCATDAWLAGPGVRARTVVRLVAAMVWVSSGLFVTFFHHYVENTQLGVACLILGLANLSRGVAGAGARRHLALGAGLLALAAVSHLQYAGMAVCVFAAALVVIGRRSVREAAHGGLCIGGVTAAVVVAAVLLVRAGPFALGKSNVAGGPDGRWLVPFVDAQGNWLAAGTLLSADHLSIVVRVLCFACPAFLVAAAVAIGTKGELVRACARQPVLLAASIAYVGFVSLYGFDLGWPADVDLMVTMVPGLLLLCTAGVAAAAEAMSSRGRAVLVVVMLVAVLGTLLQVQPIVYHRARVLAQGNSPTATLFVPGAGSGSGPIRIAAARGTTVDLQVRGTPGTPFFLCKGAQRPAVGGDPYGRGVTDVLVPHIEASIVVHTGVFDANGASACTWTVEPLENGEPPGLQMIVAPAADQTPCLSAALYFVWD